MYTYICICIVLLLLLRSYVVDTMYVAQHININTYYICIYITYTYILQYNMFKRNMIWYLYQWYTRISSLYHLKNIILIL